MLLLLLFACGATNTTDSASNCGTTDSTTTETADTVDTSATAPEFAKYKVDTPTTLRGVYSSGSGVYLASSRGMMWEGSATDAWSTFAGPAELGSADILGMWATGADEAMTMAIVDENGGVGLLNASTWVSYSLGTKPNRGVSGTSVTDVYVVGDNGVQHFDGTAWTLEASPTVKVNAVSAFSGGAWACGNEGEVLQRAADGTWSALDTGKVANFYGIYAASDSNVTVVGDQGVIMHYDGSSWAQQSADGVLETLNAVFGATDGTLITVGNNGAALRYAGAQWTALTSDTNQNLYAVHGVSGKNAWVGGNGGYAAQYKSSD